MDLYRFLWICLRSKLLYMKAKHYNQRLSLSLNYIVLAGQSKLSLLEFNGMIVHSEWYWSRITIMRSLWRTSTIACRTKNIDFKCLQYSTLISLIGDELTGVIIASCCVMSFAILPIKKLIFNLNNRSGRINTLQEV